MSAIEKELLAVTKLKSKKDEDRQDYLARLCKAVAKIKDPEWEALSSEAQEWNNDAAEAVRAAANIVDFPDAAKSAPKPEVDEEDDEEAPAKPAKAAKAPPKTSGKRASACHTIKMLVAKNPSISVADLSTKLKDSSLKVSDVTVATLRSDTRDTLRVLNDLGLGEFKL